jgi:2-polyprenyl-3-methyl-5-hydroxy-6-metoxy-1,4-benzoquinol methylase
LIHGYIPGVKLPAKKYDGILSSSLLHHLPAPSALWQTVRRYAKPGTLVFVVDLRRPATLARAKALTKKYCTGGPEVLRRDFFNSLRAAFTSAEVRRQLRTAGIGCLGVRSISDRHLLVAGQWVD